MNISYDATVKMKLSGGKVAININNDDPIMEIGPGEKAELITIVGSVKCITLIWISNEMVYCTEQVLKKMAPFPIYPYTGTYVEKTNELDFRSINMIKDVRQCMSEPQEYYTTRTLSKYRI